MIVDPETLLSTMIRDGTRNKVTIVATRKNAGSRPAREMSVPSARSSQGPARGDQRPRRNRAGFTQVAQATGYANRGDDYGLQRDQASRQSRVAREPVSARSASAGARRMPSAAGRRVPFRADAGGADRSQQDAVSLDFFHSDAPGVGPITFVDVPADLTLAEICAMHDRLELIDVRNRGLYEYVYIGTDRARHVAPTANDVRMRDVYTDPESAKKVVRKQVRPGAGSTRRARSPVRDPAHVVQLVSGTDVLATCPVSVPGDLNLTLRALIDRREVRMSDNNKGYTYTHRGDYRVTARAAEEIVVQDILENEANTRVVYVRILPSRENGNRVPAASAAAAAPAAPRARAAEPAAEAAADGRQAAEPAAAARSQAAAAADGPQDAKNPPHVRFLGEGVTMEARRSEVRPDDTLRSLSDRLGWGIRDSTDYRYIYNVNGGSSGVSEVAAIYVRISDILPMLDGVRRVSQTRVPPLQGVPVVQDGAGQRRQPGGLEMRQSRQGSAAEQRRVQAGQHGDGQIEVTLRDQGGSTVLARLARLEDTLYQVILDAGRHEILSAEVEAQHSYRFTDTDSTSQVKSLSTAIRVSDIQPNMFNNIRYVDMVPYGTMPQGAQRRPETVNFAPSAQQPRRGAGAAGLATGLRTRQPSTRGSSGGSPGSASGSSRQQPQGRPGLRQGRSSSRQEAERRS